jgi:hypothetical protein
MHRKLWNSEDCGFHRNSSGIKVACKENLHIIHYSVNKSVRKAIMCTVHCMSHSLQYESRLPVTLHYYLFPSYTRTSRATISLSHYINVNQLEWWIPRHIFTIKTKPPVAPWHWRSLHGVAVCVIANYWVVLLHFANTAIKSRWNVINFGGFEVVRALICLLACNESTLPLSQEPKLVPISN